MIKHNKLLNVIIPLRSKSKSIKNKNFLKVGKYPLAIKCINTVLKSKIATNIIVATDSKEYVLKIKKYFTNEKRIEYFLRSKKSSLPNSKTEVVIGEVLKKLNFQNVKNILLVQATSPALNHIDLKKSFNKFLKFNYDSLFSCYESKVFFWKKTKKGLIPLNYNHKNRPMRQKFVKNLVENGAFYYFKKKGFEKHKNRLFQNIGFYTMPEDRSFEIDEPNDIKKIKNIQK